MPILDRRSGARAARPARSASLALVLSLAVMFGCLGASQASAQERLTGLRSVMLSPVFETWSFSGDLKQPMGDGPDSLLIGDAQQWMIPLSVLVPLGRRWAVDVTAAYASSEVTLGDGAEKRTVSLAGPTDTRIRLTGRFAGDNLLLTLGVNAPTGSTSLDEEEITALRIIGSPALGAQIPTLGTGFGGTAGIVFARPVGEWAWAFGASYEMRSEYAPLAVVGGIASPDFNPSDVVHLSLGTSGLVGAHEMTFGVSADLFSEDKLTLGGSSDATTRLGPIYTVEWELRLAAPRFRELALSVVDRYRSSYEQGGETVENSSGNYVDVALRGALPLRTGTDLVLALGGRHHTGLDSDNSLASAALASGTMSLGLAQDLGSGYLLQPFVRGQLGRVESADASADLTGLAVGIGLGRRF